ncbi:putative nuclease HARBI1 [Anopheles marshallii]|uniref:putative nuclease HARBI1 n=1 Tax=Anopheles marshallii TaxID=1521116 RepID=UPI00237ADA73|nr:putative nuclease HARBI1 [Anopheles marshallii]
MQGISLEDKLAACLRFFAEGKYQLGIGKDYNIAIARSTFSKVLDQLIPPLEKAICGEWISIQMTEDEKRDAKRFFREKCGIEDILMCVDGTHVKIKKPTHRPMRFLNRKKYYSLNVMIVCDHNYRIRAVDARYPGANHDAHVWRMSSVKNKFEEWHNIGDAVKILGDAGYPAEPWLIRPYRAPEDGSAEFVFNTRHARARSIVERTIGLLKKKFSCLLGDNGQLNYAPEKCGRMINICCALHNMCIQNNIYLENEIITIDNREGDE